MALRGWMRRPLAQSSVLVAGVLLLVLALRAAGLLVPLDLLAYDLGVRLRAGEDVDPRIVLVTQTEDDLRRLGFPASDETLARILEILTQMKAAAIGVDIYRDLPVAPGTARLEAAIKANPNIVWVTKFAENGAERIPPPAVLAGSATQIGFNDLADDPGGVVRRGLLFLDDGKDVFYSFALQLALKYLEPRGKRLGPAQGEPERVRLGEAVLSAFEKDDGGYVDVDAAGHQFLLDFRGALGKFPRHSFGALLAGKVEPAQIAGRIVIVGTAAESLKDFFYTPLSDRAAEEARMLGAELHAHVASQLLRLALDGALALRAVGEPVEILWLALWCALGGVVGFSAHSAARFALVALASIAVLLAVSLGLFVQYIWLPLVAPLAGNVLSVTAVAALTAYQEKAQRAVLMRLFAKHVSGEIAEEIWRRREEFLAGDRPRAQQLVATVLFTDIRNFTTVSEKLGPPQLLDWLNEYMEAMTRVVIGCRGVVNKYIGDSVMAVFGVPLARRSEEEIAQDARNAVRCALEMERTLEQLNRRWQAQGGPVIAMRAGIFTGPVVAGSLGGGERMEYTVVGDTVNIASRLESYDKAFAPPEQSERACRILIGEATARRLGTEFGCVPVGEVELKGRKERLLVYYVLRNPPIPASG